MAYADARFGYQQLQTDSALDNKAPAFIDTDSSALVLEGDMMQSPSDAFRKNSFANSNGVLSPADSQTWDHPFTTGLSSDPASAGAPHAYHEDGNVFLRQSNPNVPPYPMQHRNPSWGFEHGSGNSTPTTGGEFMPPPLYDGARFVHQRSEGAHGSYGQQQPLPQHFIPAPQVQTPMSPHSHQDWMGMAEREMESRPSHKRMRPNSPPRSMSDFQRRDGIRKKNGRIEIPQERSIDNIDELIEAASDDEMRKELKQQKRLLRNREAALASRQRKKKHTEDLEVKEKSYTQKIASLESKVNELTREREHWSREQQSIHQRLQEALRMIDTMRDERQELVRAHTEETSQLRRQRESLKEALEAGPAPAMSAQSSSAFSDLYPGMEALHMNVGGQDWQQQDWVVGDFFPSQGDIFNSHPEPVKPTAVPEKRTASTLATQGPNTTSVETSNDTAISKPAAVCALLMLGAALASSQIGNSQPTPLPSMPANVRAAAPAILNDLLAEFDSTAVPGSSYTMSSTGHQPLSSAAGYPASRPGRMERVHRSITAPTKQQDMDQAFSLTAAQYTSMTNTEFSSYAQPSVSIQNEGAPTQRRPLAEALASLEENQAHSSKAEVYTRSLLWEQIPADVVRQFKDIVRDHNALDGRQQHQGRRPSHDFTFKIET